MTSQQVSQALTLARSEGFDSTGIDDSVLHGCALPGFKQVTTTIEVVAKFLAWHVFLINGNVDSEALNDLSNVLRHRVLVI